MQVSNPNPLDGLILCPWCATGPVCLVKLPHHIPIGLHGCWSDEYFGPAVPAREEYPRDWAPKFSTVGH